MWEIPRKDVEKQIRITMRELEFLRNKANATKYGSVKIRLLAREPAFSFSLRNPDKPDGVLRAGLRVYGHGASKRAF